MEKKNLFVKIMEVTENELNYFDYSRPTCSGLTEIKERLYRSIKRQRE